MNAKVTKAAAVSSTRSAANKRKPRRPSKLALLRVKVVTIVAAIVLFVAGAAGIALYNPAVASSQAAAPAAVPAQQITVVKPGGSNSLVVPSPPRVTAVRPFMRSRGS